MPPLSTGIVADDALSFRPVCPRKSGAGKTGAVKNRLQKKAPFVNASRKDRQGISGA
jgi:hypothetical protein